MGVYDLAEMGEATQSEVREAYKSNLRYVLRKVDNFVENLEGKTVITADHGDLLGENGLYGHYLHESEIRQLRVVPWDILGDRIDK